MHAFIGGFIVGGGLVALLFSFRHALMTIAEKEYNKASAKIAGTPPTGAATPPPAA